MLKYRGSRLVRVGILGAELIALMWIGRGDYDASQFSEAVAEAKSRNDIKPARYLLNRPMLGEWLEDGLQAIGA